MYVDKSLRDTDRALLYNCINSFYINTICLYEDKG